MKELIEGAASIEGTRRYQSRFEGRDHIAQGHFRTLPQGLSLTSLGMGTYLGEPDKKTFSDTVEAATRSLSSGAINVLDTAINYRAQASERAIGQAIGQLIEKGAIQRDEVFICSKNGYLTPDAVVQENFQQYFYTEYIQSGILEPQDIVGGMHAMSPRFLEDQLSRSLNNLGLQTLDLMYLHNAAESQLAQIGTKAFFDKLKAAFEFYETARQENRIRFYGLATWNCFRTPQNLTSEYLDLEAVVKLAEEVGGVESHGFRFIQLPYNLAMPEAMTLKNQRINGQPYSTLEACEKLGIGVFTSVPLLQGQLLDQIHGLHFKGLTTAAQACLQFVRSTPGVLAPLVGQTSPKHVDENLQVASVPPLTPSEFEAYSAAPSY